MKNFYLLFLGFAHIWWYDDDMMRSHPVCRVQFCCWWLLQPAKPGEVHGYEVLWWHTMWAAAEVLAGICFSHLLIWSFMTWPHSSQEELITRVQTPRLMWKRSRGHPGFEWCLARSNLSKANKNKIMSQHLSLLPWKRESYNPLVKSDPLAPLDSWVTLWWSVLHWLTSTTSFPACLQHANHVGKASQRWEGCARKGCRVQELL